MAVRPQILLATFCLITLTQVYSIKIGSFNIQLFGQSKVAKDDVVDVLVQILNRYDLLLIMEIRDKAGTAIVELLDALNNVSSENYKMVISSRTGRSTSKEQYTFFYKPELFEVTDQYEYDDGDEELKEDTFEREPFIVRFSSPSTLVKDFAMVGIHTKPDDAFNEIDTLADVYDDITEKWNIEDVIIAGDFNAGCSYVKDWTGNRLRQDRFKWLVKDDADTNVAHKQCPYDRFVIGGNSLFEGVKPQSTQVFNFSAKYGLDEEFTKTVSDHYPIEFQLLEIQSPKVLYNIEEEMARLVLDEL